MIALVNARTEQTIASEIEVADTRGSRRRGLLGRDAIDLAAALVLAPCWAVHTAFMRFAIDVVFVNEDGCVVRIASHVGPWRVVIARQAYAAIELAAGATGSRMVLVGDRLYTRSGDGFGLASSLFESVSFRRMAAKPACSGS